MFESEYENERQRQFDLMTKYRKVKKKDYENSGKITREDFERFLSEIDESSGFGRDRRALKEYNAKLSEYFAEYYGEVKRDVLDKTAKALLVCNDWWLMDVYQKERIMEIKRSNLCRCRLCPNCQKMLQASRLYHFASAIEKTAETANLFLLTLTVPNSTADNFVQTVSCMYDAFSKLIRFLNGTKKIRGVSFSDLGYRAAFRSFEVTYKRDDYHPHFHVILAVSKDFWLDKKILNKYSYSFFVKTRSFSDFEILIQKLWRLLFDYAYERYELQVAFNTCNKRSLERYIRKKRDLLEKEDIRRERYNNLIRRLGYVPRSAQSVPFDSVEEFVALDRQRKDFEQLKKPKLLKISAERVTKKDIDNLDIGYSCTMDYLTGNDYYEPFKYICKVVDDDHNFMSYEQFKVLYDELKSRRIVQGYGEWFNFVDKGIEDSLDKQYDDIKGFLNSIEKPYEFLFDYSEVSAKISNEHYRLFSRKRIRNILKELEDFKNET
ncbi:MAG: protein rep [Clostridiales bacterium]|nr:protein rep [Clostridiales bacterium]